MNRRDFVRALVATVAAVLAGVPIAQAWREARERAEREAMILAHIKKQAEHAVREFSRTLGEQLYGPPFPHDWKGWDVAKLEEAIGEPLVWRVGP